MTIFLIVFLLYIALRLYFRERQKSAGNIFMIGSRFTVLPDHVRLISILGMVGIGLVIIILSIMGYPLTTDQIAQILTLGIIIMSVQYLPLYMIGERGIVSIDSQVNWNDITSVRVQHNKNNGAARIKIGFKSADENSTVDVYIHSSQIEDFGKIVTELTSVQLERLDG